MTDQAMLDRERLSQEAWRAILREGFLPHNVFVVRTRTTEWIFLLLFAHRMVRRHKERAKSESTEGIHVPNTEFALFERLKGMEKSPCSYHWLHTYAICEAYINLHYPPKLLTYRK